MYIIEINDIFLQEKNNVSIFITSFIIQWKHVSVCKTGKGMDASDPQAHNLNKSRWSDVILTHLRAGRCPVYDSLKSGKWMLIKVLLYATLPR